MAGGFAAGIGALAIPTVRDYLDLLAPGSGQLWGGLGPPPSGTIDSPYGDATVVYDDEGVPHIESDGELALQYAHGYVQGYDRLFQLDLFRRQLRGNLSEVAGEATVETDEFHRRMDFAAAAAASAAAIEDTDTYPVLEAFVDGVNAARVERTAPVETDLLDYEIEPWTVTDSLLIEKLMGWDLTGRFRTLRRAALAEEFDRSLVDALFPSRYDHDVPIIRGASSSSVQRPSTDATVPPEAATWLSSFEAPRGQGSNSWVVSGDHTTTGGPILANDPHLLLSSPPIWYEVGLETPTFATRGVTFPGTPFVVIGRNRQASWGLTNVPADVMDFYTYDVDGDQYRIGDDWYAFETQHQQLAVAGESDRELELRWTDHGPFIERHEAEVAIQWTGLGATKTVDAVRQLQFVDDHESLLEAMSNWDLPPQNLVYADEGGRTRYQMVGKIPIRRTDGEAVRGDQVFDGSAMEGTWQGFTSYQQPTWEDFIPLAELPHVVDPAVISTANQRVVDDPEHYLAEIHSAPYRARRIDSLLTEATSDVADIEDMIDTQQDLRDELAATLVPEILDAIDAADEGFESIRSALEAWDYRMAVDSWAAVVFEIWLRAFRKRVFVEPLSEAGLDTEFHPSDWILATLEATHPWYDEVGSREDHLLSALDAAAEEASEYDDYGDFQQTSINHPFEVGFLNYPRYPMPGSAHTVKNYRRDSPVGPGWQQIVDHGTDEAVGRLAGGNVGRLLSPHYDDQLRPWIEGRYKSLDWTPTEKRRLEFQGDDE